MRIKSDPQVDSVFDNYPEHVRPKLLDLRELILQTAAEIGIDQVEETLKWGEPSYIARHGSTIRMDWKQRSPDQYALYFQCTSQLVPTFRNTFDGLMDFEGNRAIVGANNFKMPPLSKSQFLIALCNT